MQCLANKRILLGITGGVAAYKSAELVRRLQDQGAEVRVVMTRGSQQFITPLTLQALSGHPVSTDLLDPAAEAAMGHIELARWAELVLVAPATADFMARLAHGHAGDLLTTLCLATDARVMLAPAMNQAMWSNPATQRNQEVLRGQGVALLGPAVGLQACGDNGPGRMLEVPELVDGVCRAFPEPVLNGKRVMITAGPTREALDPVRYLSNHSSGKMGFALAEAASHAGAEVVLVSGPTSLPCPAGVTRIDVESAQSMLEAVHQRVIDCDLFIACAAVADYRPATVQEHKIKKSVDTDDDALQLTLVRNPDIVASVAALKQRPFVVGFAAETRDVLSYAADKRMRKGLDLIVANDVSDTEIGFNSDDNAVTVLGENLEQSFAQVSKQSLSHSLITLFAQQLDAKTTK
ncbi:bifunctional phosphopantothenoylcysteine decarboxylase/phosphopantothenate--cysteine ligase CoaBC [Aestuariirhabdus sp. Z084]|uniref:bifunctional phosphopantothenoylcysteine decarboxylase/phosphopantothenate--cysteine ligase CoaBC n=1 Tax=Aestuariirhabdus haliotis TaxID=2918751 RepID=UPI00201B409A|nr:bifunctional phosphopantothenoylcysteine decarboxylase/phosphopantothenate--cysteine ligase CoaBC [Aestuariirhabdus haliotis]MCL6414297.1 bifunctional phosphopantothenoylcysteine decarboxylase/phosphopantothenate--cysteine ligase CoaBC [Aestuariirhabdus haliotis]MCL6418229.1 bifunctional phosphopantothenoylcysteine decarboxylase/phosphopantothenate--cysteine ligase CoaBC [Aestuariirhabdus haliotis]